MHTYLASLFSALHCVPSALPRAHSDAESGLLNLPQSLVIMLVMLNFRILFVQQYIIIILCSHLHPFKHTSLQYVGLDAHLPSMPQLHTDEKTEVPCQSSFRPSPGALKYFLFGC